MSNFFVRSRPTAAWAASHAYTLGQRVVSASTTQFLGIHFEVTTAGTSGTPSEPAWNTTVGGTTTDNGVTWTTRGSAQAWQANKTYVVGDRVCKVSRSTLNSASSVVWDCTTGGTSHATTEPTWPTTITAGTTTQTDNTVTWTARACTTWDNANPFMDQLLKDTANATVKVSAGDTIYVSKTHAESTQPAAFTGTEVKFPGTASSPNRVLCVDDTAQPSSPSTLATSGKITIAGANSTTYLAVEGQTYQYGMNYESLSTSGNSSIFLSGYGGFGVNSGHIFESCSFKLGNDSGSYFALTAGGLTGSLGSLIRNRLTLINSSFIFGNASQSLALGCGEVVWRSTGSGAISGAVPTGGLFQLNSGAVAVGSVLIDGVDLSGLGANPIFSTQFNAGTYRFRISNCKLNAGTTLTSGTTVSSVGVSSCVADIINCDSGATNYKLHRETGLGTVDHETTKIKSGGANDGTTGISWKMVTNANGLWHQPLESFDIVAWNNNSGASKTATVEILTDSLTALNNDDVWLEVGYLGDAGDPLSIYANNSKANILASNAAQPTSSVTWTTTGITNVMKQKLQISFTPQQKGPVRARVLLAKASTTVYVDPVLSIA